jgi:EmrB/QacA subfamily drug resistance transporter
MLAVDIVIVTVANPSIARSLQITPEQLQWTVTAYTLTFGGFLLLGGRLSDHFGRRRMFVLGVTGFTLASVGAALSTGSAMLIAFRALQGFFAALTSPTTLALLTVSFPEGPERRRAYAYWLTAGSLGSVLGYLVGGVLTTLGWRWIFLINVPLGCIAIVGAARFIAPTPSQSTRQGLDLPGAISVTAGLTLILYGLGEGQSAGWGSPRAVASFGLGFILLSLFALIESKVANPLLPVHLLPRRESVALAIVAIVGIVVTATVFLYSLYMQEVLGYTPLQTGFGSLPVPVGVTLGAQLTSRQLLRRFGARSVCTAGLGVLTCSFALLARLSVDSQYVSGLMPALFLFGVGLAMANVSLISTVTSGVPNEEQGIVSGLFNMSMQMGAALGVAVLVTVSTTVAAATSGLPPHPAAVGIRVAYEVAAVIALAGMLAAALFLRSSRAEHSAVTNTSGEAGAGEASLPVIDGDVPTVELGSSRSSPSASGPPAYGGPRNLKPSEVEARSVVSAPSED